MQMMGNFKTVFLALVVLAMSACQTETKTEVNPPQKVKVAHVGKIASLEAKVFSGIFNATQETNLAFRVGGPIQHIYMKEGDVVKKGQLLAQMDPRDYQIQYDVAKAEFDKVTTETKRVSELYRRNSVTEVDYQKALAGEKMVKAQLDHAQDQLSDTKIFAPFTGVIQKVNFEVGELLNTGMPLATLLKTDMLEISVDVPAQLFDKKSKFESVYANAATVPNETIPLELIKYNPKANSSQLYRLVFETAKKYPVQLKPGNEAKVTIELNTTGMACCVVPTRAIFNENEQAFVWAYNASDSSVYKTAVTPNGIYNGEFTKIVKGLVGNETIVVAGIKSLTDKQKVKPLPDETKTNVGGLL
jgi:RND family efflux transporter MFP subunit